MAPGAADKKNNVLPLWGNEKTMNLNNLILTNILSSHYFKVNLYQLKTYHEVIDEIYYHVTHLEPWEKGSRKTSGQTGMCGGVRGVGAGGIVSTAFCILYKLFTLKLTRKQVIGLTTHADSPYIRALGFMYIRFTQPPVDLWDWFEQYLDDEEELDVKAGSGQVMTIGEMLRHFLTKLEWFSTLFPRIPVPIQKDLESKLSGRKSPPKAGAAGTNLQASEDWTDGVDDRVQQRKNEEETGWGDGDQTSRHRSSVSKDYKSKGHREKEDIKDTREKLDVAEEIARERERQRREKHLAKSHHSHSSEKHNRDHVKHSDRDRARSRSHSRSKDIKLHRDRDLERHKDKKEHGSRHKSHNGDRERHRDHDRERNHKKEKERDKERRGSRERVRNYERKDLERKRSRSRSPDHEKRHEKHSQFRGRDYH